MSGYREELRRHPDRHAVMRAAMRHAAPPIVASAATVGLGLLCLLAAEMNSNRSLGPVGAVGILCALLAMTTLLPAVFVAMGRWVFWPWVPGYAAAVRPGRGVWEWAGGQVARRPRAVWLATTALLVAWSTGLVGADRPQRCGDVDHGPGLGGGAAAPRRALPRRRVGSGRRRGPRAGRARRRGGRRRDPRRGPGPACHRSGGPRGRARRPRRSS